MTSFLPDLSSFTFDEEDQFGEEEAMADEEAQAGIFDEGFPQMFPGGGQQFGGNPFMGQLPGGGFNIGAGGLGFAPTPINLPWQGGPQTVFPGGIGGLTPSGQYNTLQGMISQLDFVWQQEQARRDMYTRWREQQAHLERMQQMRMDAFKDAFSGGGGDFDIEYPRGFETTEGGKARQFAYHQIPEGAAAQVGLNIPQALPDIPELPANMKQNFVGAAPGAAVAGKILNAIAGQGAQAGVDVGAGKLIQEVGKKQAALAAGQDAATAQQGVAGSRWVQDLQEAITQVQNRAQQVGLGADRFKQAAYQSLLSG